jgi:hypothetical protein
MSRLPRLGCSLFCGQLLHIAQITVHDTGKLTAKLIHCAGRIEFEDVIQEFFLCWFAKQRCKDISILLKHFGPIAWVESNQIFSVSAMFIFNAPPSSRTQNGIVHKNHFLRFVLAQCSKGFPILCAGCISKVVPVVEKLIAAQPSIGSTKGSSDNTSTAIRVGTSDEARLRTRIFGVDVWFSAAIAFFASVCCGLIRPWKAFAAAGRGSAHLFAGTALTVVVGVWR